MIRDYRSGSSVLRAILSGTSLEEASAQCNIPLLKAGGLVRRTLKIICAIRYSSAEDVTRVEIGPTNSITTLQQQSIEWLNALEESDQFMEARIAKR